MCKKNFLRKLIALLFIQTFIVCNIFISHKIYAQNISSSPKPNEANTSSTNNINNNPPPIVTKFETIEKSSYLSEREYQLSLLVLILTCFTLLLICVLFLKARSYKPDQILPTVAVVLIIGMALLLVTSGYTSSEIAPVLGLFGTIAGYLIGKGQSSEQSVPKNDVLKENNSENELKSGDKK